MSPDETAVQADEDLFRLSPAAEMRLTTAGSIPVILVGLAMRWELGVGLRTHRPMGLFYRGLVGSAAMCMSFWALALLPLPEVTAIGYAAPLLTVILTAMFLGEPVRLFRLSMVALGLLGVVEVGVLE